MTNEQLAVLLDSLKERLEDTAVRVKEVIGGDSLRLSQWHYTGPDEYPPGNPFAMFRKTTLLPPPEDQAEYWEERYDGEFLAVVEIQELVDWLNSQILSLRMGKRGK